MPHKRRKIRKLRGSRTCGWGRIGQHRKHSSKGFRKAGRHKHGWSYVLRYMPSYFGKRGFTSPKSVCSPARFINVGELDSLLRRLGEEGRLEKDDGRTLLDLSSLGYSKLLGTGSISQSVTVKVKAFSGNAARKIEDAGGQISS